LYALRQALPRTLGTTGSPGSLYAEPSEIKVPTLVVLGEWDGLNGAGAQPVFSRLTNTPYKRLVEIGQGSHLLFLEKNRAQLFREVQLFLDEPTSAN
jgi:pimeloyl-ACP methyl ester carboxylesterase